MNFRNFARGAIVAAAASLLAMTAHAQTKLTVYTALESDQIEAYKKQFEADVKGIDLVVVRDSTGVITAKLLAEKNNPHADVVWGVSASSLALMKNEGMLEGYMPVGGDKVTATYRDAANPPSWVGMDVYSAVICFNTVEAGKKNLKAPTSWKDLTDPAYRGQIAMPNPASSGTGFLMVAAWLQQMGEDAGWKFMDALHANIAAYTHSGSKTCRQAGAGEYAIGLSFDFRGSDVKKKGAPIDLIWPSEGLGWDVEASGMIKGTKNVDAAKKFLDWSVTPAAMKLYSANFAIVALPGSAQPLPFLPADLESKLAKIDFSWMAKNRERILAEWTKRYDSKSEPKK
ncbi:MAG: putative 2-aminoethylphosphonate ABC transporter substrate-binding protein [Rhodospirillales bacterium]